MHDIEPYFKWRERYVADQDSNSPLYGRVYNEFKFTKKVYNYLIHPQWDEFGSTTLYLKILFVDYDDAFACIELIGEWNDCITNDIMFLKREIIDQMVDSGINKYIFFCDNVLNFHASDDSYYEEWYDDVKEEEGWICYVNVLDHVKIEMESNMIDHYVKFGNNYNNFNWRSLQPNAILSYLENQMQQETLKIH